MTLVLMTAVCVASMFAVDAIARSQGRKARPWIWTAAIIGPFAIPMLYLVPHKRRA